MFSHRPLPPDRRTGWRQMGVWPIIEVSGRKQRIHSDGGRICQIVFIADKGPPRFISGCFSFSGGEKEMITIRFLDSETKRRALGFLAGRFSFTTWASGEVLVPDCALPALANAGISFTVDL